MNSTFRVGIGYDIHRLVEGRRLILGGVEIEHEMGLLGHSDADVVLHAITDAMLGAAGLPDIGEIYPDDIEATKDADSIALLRDVMIRVRERGYEPNNVDVIVHLETPKLSPHKPAMAVSIAEATGLKSDAVSVKAKTNEGVGPVGTQSAIACTAIVLLSSK